MNKGNELETLFPKADVRIINPEVVPRLVSPTKRSVSHNVEVSLTFDCRSRVYDPPEREQTLKLTSVSPCSLTYTVHAVLSSSLQLVHLKAEIPASDSAAKLAG